MCIWLPNWPSQRASVAKRQADLPKAVGPIILFRRDSRRGNLVATANQTARRAGILPHMPLSQCGPLCPDATLIEYDPQSDVEALVQLAESAQCFSPIVGLESLDPDIWAGRSVHEPHSLLMDVTGVTELFQGEAEFTQAVHRWMLQRGFLAVIAIANQVGQAWALANYTYRNAIADKLLQMEAATPGDSAAAGDLASIIIHDNLNNESSAGIVNLPIEALRLDVSNCSKLHRLGIRRISQLTALPRSGLTSRFGEILLRRLDQTVGHQDEPIQSLHVTPELECDETLEFSTPHRDDVRNKIEAQIQCLARRLDSLGQGALRVVCRISLEQNAFDVDDAVFSVQDQSDSTTSLPKSKQTLASVLQIGLFQPTSDAEHLMWLMQTQIDAPSFRLDGSYWAKGIRTQITLAAPLKWSQGSLFESESAKHRDAIAKFVDNVSVRLGRSSVLTPVSLPNPLPEATFAWRPMTGWRRDGQQQDSKRKLRRAPKRDYQSEEITIGPNKEDVWRRPTQLLATPLSLQVTEFSKLGTPQIVCYPRSNVSVMHCVGPERIESGWWHGATQRRDYYRVALENGVWLWCFLDQGTRSWFLHGIFD
jgi:protein ImuB